jgi:2-iminobutanoate/2-iminopropanoate deaminase
VHISGQIGVKPDGTVADGAEGQLEQAWRNIFASLEAAGMTKRDLVKATTFLAPHAADSGCRAGCASGCSRAPSRRAP